MNITIDYTALSYFMDCPRRFYWRQVRELVPRDVVSLGAQFGQSGHSGLGTLYLSGGDVEGACGAFKEVWGPFEGKDESGLRTMDKGKEILEAYKREFWGKEAWETTGNEVQVMVPLSSEVNWSARIDLLGRSEGVDAIQEWKFLKSPTYFTMEPNLQILGYLWAASRHFGIPYRRAIVTLCGVLKTSKEGVYVSKGEKRSIFGRDVITTEEWALEEWKQTVLDWVDLLLECKEKGRWPMNAPGACGGFGGCFYRGLCNSDPGVRETLVEMQYRKEKWAPWEKEEI